MNASIQQLRQLIASPGPVIEGGQIRDWSLVETKLGTSLPTDYKTYVENFGAGSFNSFLMPLSPFSAHSNLFQALDEHYQAERSKRVNFPEDQTSLVEPFLLYPAPKGLLPWGKTANFGDFLYWQREGPPEHWPTILYNLRDGIYETFQTTMTEFLIGVLSKQFHPNLFPKDFPGHQPITFLQTTD
jgi:hypothetical protein